MNLACVDLESLHSNALSDPELANTAQHLTEIHTRTNLGGIALRCDKASSPDKLNHLLEILYCQGVPILLLGSHDSDVWDSLNFGNAAGIIVENATILPSGQRRDYFRARTLRQIMARCSKEREQRPEFFVGFLELWAQRPHPAVVRRSVKLAEHFGAVVEHAPAKPGTIPDNTLIKSASQTLSGFEFLRRGAQIEVSRDLRWTKKFDAANRVLIMPLASKVLEYRGQRSVDSRWLQSIFCGLSPAGRSCINPSWST